MQNNFQLKNCLLFSSNLFRTISHANLSVLHSDIIEAVAWTLFIEQIFKETKINTFICWWQALCNCICQDIYLYQENKMRENDFFWMMFIACRNKIMIMVVIVWSILCLKKGNGKYWRITETLVMSIYSIPSQSKYNNSLVCII